MHSENTVHVATDSSDVESNEKKFTIGTRDKDGKVAIFHADAETYLDAMQMVKDAMIEDGVENPVVFANVKGV